MQPKMIHFIGAINSLVMSAKENGDLHVDINAGALHRRVGNYPGPNHRMATCCAAMKRFMEFQDEILSSPQKGVGASLTIRYYISKNQKNDEFILDKERCWVMKIDKVNQQIIIKTADYHPEPLIIEGEKLIKILKYLGLR